MAFLFRNKQKSNAELTRSTKDLTVRLSQEDKPNPKVQACFVGEEPNVADPCQLEEELARDLQQMKLRLQGTPGTVTFLLFATVLLTLLQTPKSIPNSCSSSSRLF
jgi:calcium binding protein 39